MTVKCKVTLLNKTNIVCFEWSFHFSHMYFSNKHTAHPPPHLLATVEFVIQKRGEGEKTKITRTRNGTKSARSIVRGGCAWKHFFVSNIVIENKISI